MLTILGIIFLVYTLCRKGIIMIYGGDFSEGKYFIFDIWGYLGFFLTIFGLGVNVGVHDEISLSSAPIIIKKGEYINEVVGENGIAYYKMYYRRNDNNISFIKLPVYETTIKFDNSKEPTLVVSKKENKPSNFIEKIFYLKNTEVSYEVVIPGFI